VAARAEGARAGWRRFRRHRAGLPSLILLVGLGGLVLLAPWVSPHDPERQYGGEELWPPKPGFWFGTDDFGRDILSRCLHGAQLSLGTGLVAAGLAGLTGTALGMLAGYRRGRLDELLGRVFDAVLAFPGLLTGLAVAVFLGKGLYNAAIAAAVINLPLVARLARAGVLSEREKEYTLAAQAIGTPTGRIVARHLLPNILPVVLVQVTMTIADAMIIEAGLSFLGLGAQPPRPSLGTMLRDSREFLTDAAWYALFPGLMLTLFLLLISFLSEALVHTFDPRRLGGGAGR
jgi:peptide/nickel transport system permease protein